MSKKICKLAACLVIILQAMIFSPGKAFAQNINIKCDPRFQNYIRSASFPDTINMGEKFTVQIAFTSLADTSFNYQVKATRQGFGINDARIGNFDVRSEKLQITNPQSPVLTFTMDSNNADNLGAFNVSLVHSEGLGEEEVCKLGTMNFSDKNMNETSCNLKLPANVEQGQPFTINLAKTDQPDIQSVVYIFSQQKIDINKLPRGGSYLEIAANEPPIKKFVSENPFYDSGELPKNNPGESGITINYPNSGDKRLAGGNYIAVAETRRWLGRAPGVGVGINPGLPIIPGAPVGYKLDNRWIVSYCSYHPFTASSNPTSPETDGTGISTPGTGGTLGGGETKTETCLEKKRHDPTVNCAEGGGDSCSNDLQNPGIKTAIGCVHTNPAAFVKDILTWVIGISGGIAFLMMLLGVFQMLTSAGNPETLQTGRDRLTSAVIGLLFIVFAVLLLQIIGVDILGLKGFEK